MGRHDYGMGRLRIDMTPERRQRMSHLYDAALACDAKERAVPVFDRGRETVRDASSAHNRAPVETGSRLYPETGR